MEPPTPAVTDQLPAPVSAPIPARVVEAESNAAVVEPPALNGLGIPIGMQAQIRRLVDDLDRPVTAVDIQQATRLPLSIAARVVDRFTPAIAR
ncbi:hypothetical protein ACH4OY_23610 [Micromonospora rubida]|uniref:Uncharacterized protein n=1 Tax=Micromonospora rubida TaxID=2697657 RepID=A0ABW7SR94_9ACTN